MLTTSVTTWVDEELETLDLGDPRRNKRCSIILQAFGDQPNLSIPAKCNGHDEMVGAYRFFDNPNVTYDNILAAHYVATEKRVCPHEIVLFPQDTTSINLTRPEQQIDGVGPIDGDPDRYGTFVHTLHAFTPDAVPLGTVWSKQWTRPLLAQTNDIPKIPRSVKREQKIKAKHKRHRSVPFAEKESYRWLEGYRQVIQLARRNPSTICVCMGDSESDIYDVLVEPRVGNVHVLIRACQNRNVVEEESQMPGRLRETVSAMPLIATATVYVQARKGRGPESKQPRQRAREAREAALEIRAATVEIQSPALTKRHDSVTMSVVLAVETNAPQGCVPIEWILLTTLPIETKEDVEQIIEYYTVRWTIEIFFRTLKSGCRIEKLQFEKMDRFLRCLAICMIVAWRTLMICRMGRSYPNASCEVVFEPSEWKATYCTIHETNILPPKPPTLGEMIKWVGELGGWVRRQDEYPGPQTTWTGLQRVRTLACGWRLFGPESRKRQKVV